MRIAACALLSLALVASACGGSGDEPAQVPVPTSEPTEVAPSPDPTEPPQTQPATATEDPTSEPADPLTPAPDPDATPDSTGGGTAPTAEPTPDVPPVPTPSLEADAPNPVRCDAEQGELPYDGDGDGTADGCKNPDTGEGALFGGTSEPLACEPVVVHGEPHASEPVDTDGDGYEDGCGYADHLEHDDVETFICEDGTQVEAKPSAECRAAVIVPYLLGETAAAAVARLEALGLGWEVDSPTPGDSRVLGQRPQVGAEVLSGSVVVLITSIPIVIPTAAPEVTATPTAIPVPTATATAVPISTAEPEAASRQFVENGEITDYARQLLGCPPYGDMFCAVGDDGMPFAREYELPPNTVVVASHSPLEWDLDVLRSHVDAIRRESFDAKVAVARAEVLAEAGVEPGTREAAEIIGAQGMEIARRATLAIVAEAEQRCDCRR